MEKATLVDVNVDDDVWMKGLRVARPHVVQVGSKTVVSAEPESMNMVRVCRGVPKEMLANHCVGARGKEIHACHSVLLLTNTVY